MSTATSTYGPAYSEVLDGARIQKQHEVIRDFMLNNGWFTLAELHEELGYPEASISAQLRHLRKPAFGEYQVEKQRRGLKGTWVYSVLPPRRRAK
jgi:predicted HTH transcriptional regulator